MQTQTIEELWPTLSEEGKRLLIDIAEMGDGEFDYEFLLKGTSYGKEPRATLVSLEFKDLIKEKADKETDTTFLILPQDVRDYLQQYCDR